MLRKSSGQFIRVVALLMLVLAGSSTAQAQQAGAASPTQGAVVTGRNAMSVTIGLDGIKAGEIRKASGTAWEETDSAGKVVAQFQEVKRDESSVFLADRGRGVNLQLDLRTRRATYTDRATRRNVLYDIQNSSSVGAPVVAAKAETNAFCWNDFITRTPGTIPGRVADCPAGFTYDGAACKRAAESVPAPSRAADCPAGYNNVGGSCERGATTKPNTNSRPADCPDGFNNTGSACFRLSAPTPLGMDVMTCKAGEVKLAGRCYKSCEAGFTAAGANCTRPGSTLGADKMTCKAGFKKTGDGNRCNAECAAGLTNNGDACVRPAQTLGQESMTCKAGETRQGSRCVPAAGSCAKGEVLQGGMCYNACPPGFDGVGTACFAPPPKTWSQCGMGSAKNAQACAPLLDPLASVKQAAVLVGVLGGSEPAGAAQRSAQLPAMQKRFKDMQEAYAKAKDLPQFKKGQGAWEQANRGKDAQSLDNMATATTEADMMRYATQLLAIVDLSGGVNLDATPYPKCSKVAGK